MKKKLAIVKPASSLITLPPTAPPPRKEDIIKAMVERARVKHKEESDAHEAKRSAAVARLDEAILAQLKANPGAFERVVHGEYYSSEVVFTLKITPPHIRELKEKVRIIGQFSRFDEAETKKHIRESLNDSGVRVNALLNNPDAVKALDAALAKIA